MNIEDRSQLEPDPADLEREIDRQRDHINELVSALGSKLGGRLSGGDLVSQLGSKVKDHPMPTMLTLAGLVWLYSSHDKDEVRVSTASADGSVGMETGSDGGDRMQHLREGASEKWSSAKTATRERAHRASEGFQHRFEDNPLALGAVGIAVGALLGALLPHTQKEDELMGEASARLKESAKGLAKSGYEQVAQAGREVTGRPPGEAAARSTSTLGQPPTQGRPS